MAMSQQAYLLFYLKRDAPRPVATPDPAPTPAAVPPKGKLDFLFLK
jgi:hypothetical protein